LIDDWIDASSSHRLASSPLVSPSLLSVLAMNAETEHIIRSRYIEKDSDVAKIVKKFEVYQQVINNNNNKTEEKQNTIDVTAAYSQLVREIELYEWNISRYNAVQSNLTDEFDYYTTLHNQLNQQITSTEEELSQLNEELLVQTKLRTEREEYEKIYATIHNYPARNESNTQIKQLQQELTILGAQREAIIQAVQSRQEQSNSLLSSIDALSQQWQQQEKSLMSI
jgi:chromosome segregation ATPase